MYCEQCKTDRATVANIKLFFTDTGEEQDPASKWLSSVAQATMHSYVESILRIPELTDFASKQLIADIGKSITLFIKPVGILI
jgi:hypothetical protein